MGLIALSLLLGIIGSLLAAELYDWSPGLVKLLIAFAVGRLQPEQRERYSEEWSSHADEVPGHISRLIVGLGFCFAAVRMGSQPLRRSALMRAVDLVVVTAAIITLAPMLIIVAIAIAISSPGPIFARHERVGQGGRTFGCLKFRTMHVRSEDVLKAHLEGSPLAREEWKRSHQLRKDPRLTSIGAFLRRSSLDELPQLVNVLRGEMSIVGPRPISPAEREHYGEVIKDYEAIRPGITGLWQNTNRVRTSYEDRSKLVREYSRNRSALLNLVIFVRMLVFFFTRRGDY